MDHRDYLPGPHSEQATTSEHVPGYGPRQLSGVQGLGGTAPSNRGSIGRFPGSHSHLQPGFLAGVGEALPPGVQALDSDPLSGSTSTLNSYRGAPQGQLYGTGGTSISQLQGPNPFQSRHQPAIGSLPKAASGSNWQPGKPSPQLMGSSSSYATQYGTPVSSLGPQIGAFASSRGPQIGSTIGQIGPQIGTRASAHSAAAPGAAPSVPRGSIGTAEQLGRRPSFGNSTAPSGGGPIGQAPSFRGSSSSQRLIGQRSPSAFTAASGLQYTSPPPPDGVVQRMAPGPQIGSTSSQSTGPGSFQSLQGMPAANRVSFTGMPDRLDSSSTTASLPYGPGSHLSPAGTVDSLSGGLERLSVSQDSMAGLHNGPHTPHSALASPPPSARQPPSGKVKVICSSGGHFMRLANGGFEYEGGETRLVSISNGCTFKELIESLERITGSNLPQSSSSDRSEGLGPSLRFQLPSEPNTYVDLVDDEDVKLMFDEWADYVAGGRHAAAKLHIFVDWQQPQPRASSRDSALLTNHRASTGSIDGRLGSVPEGRPMQSPNVSGGSPGFPGDPARPHEQSVRHQPRSPQGDGRAVAPHPYSPQQEQGQDQAAEPPAAAAPGSTGSGLSQGQRNFNLREISDKLEIISPEDVTLLKFLGAGGYGEVYLGKWHSSEAAIKCLNPSLFAGGEAGGVSNIAMAELIREAEILSGLRHPNVVWVYGIVLPRLSEDAEFDPDHLCEDAVDIAACTVAQTTRGQPGAVRAPAIVTEFLSQGSLRGVLSRKSDLLQGALVRVLIAMDAAKGMEYLHSKKIVHFDLKSANLLLGYRDRRAICKVADFGLSKQKRETYVSGVSSQRGTLPWIAPEIIKTPHAVTEKVDVFSFGVVLWELWTGREPYEGLNYHALLHQITTSATTVRPVLPGTPEWESTGEPSPPEPCPGYQSLVERCWCDQPGKRPTFREIVASLRTMAATLRPARRSSALGLPPGAAGGGMGEDAPAPPKPQSEPSSPNHPARDAFQRGQA